MKFMVKITSVFQMLILAGAGLFGNTWSVDNNPGRSPDFTEIRDAVASADVMGGDTRYVDGSTTKYIGTIFFQKPLVIIGVGFFFYFFGLLPAKTVLVYFDPIRIFS